VSYRKSRGAQEGPVTPAIGVANVLGTYLRLQKLAHRLENREEGQGLVEYALIIVLVSIAAIVAMGLLGTAVSNVFSTITTTL
jgi:pilus assembly protein Flp/PilA